MTVFAVEERDHFPQPDAPESSDVVKVTDQPSDKFGIWNSSAVGTDKPYQLLPADQTRKDALILCMGNPIYIGDMGSISNALTTPYSVGFLPPGVFCLPASDLINGPVHGFEYDSKQGLYACCAVGAAVSQVQLIVSRFESGTPIT